jgi:hypothetical protein
MEELSQLEDLENLENSKEILFGSEDTNFEVFENIESSHNVNSDLLFFNDTLDLEDLDDLQSSYINDLVGEDDFDDNFDDDFSDLNELTEFMYNQYDSFIIPHQTESRTYSEDFDFEHIGLLTLNNLQARDLGNFNSSQTYLNQENLEINKNYYNNDLIKI